MAQDHDYYKAGAGRTAKRQKRRLPAASIVVMADQLPIRIAAISIT